MKQYEEQAAENHELQRLRDLVLSDYSQPSSVVLAAKAELSRQVMKQAPMRPPYLDLAQEHSNIQPQPPYHPSYQSRGQGNTRGRGGMQITRNWRDNTGLKKEGNPHPPRSSSKNPYVNMSIAYDKNIHLCVGCGKTGHVKPNCKNPPLQLWEQAYLKQMVFGGPGISAHLLILESEGAYYEEAENSQNQEHGYAFEKASAASSVLSNPAWAPSLKDYCTQRITDVPIQISAESKNIFQSMKTENYVDSESKEESISLKAFLTGPARKRQRSEQGRIEVQDLLDSESSSRPRKKKTSVGKPERNGMKAVKALREIVGREGLGPLNYRALAEKINVPLNLLEFFQASPDAAKEFRKMSQRLNIRKGSRTENKTKTKAKISADSASVKADSKKAYSRETLTQSDFNIDPKTNLPRVNPEHKAFHFVAVLRGRYDEKYRWKKVTLSPGISQADQGSELNIISQGLVNAMAFPRYTLSREKDDSGLFVSTTDGGATELKEFTCFNVGVSRIWRRVYAFIRP